MSTVATLPTATRRLLVVDDHPITRRGLAELLAHEPDLTVAGHAASAAEALTLLRAAAFDLAVVDVSLRGVSGIDLLKDLKIHWPRMPVLVFSTHDELLYAERVLHGNRDPGTPSNVIDQLSNRELEVFRLLGHGRGTRDIAQEMHVSVKTVETYRAHIKQKLQLTTAPELMRVAIEWSHAAEA